MRKKAWILCTAMVVTLAGCSNVSDNNTTDIIQVSSEMVTTTEAATEVTATTESETTTEKITESNIPDSALQSEGSNTGKTEPAATEAKTTESKTTESQSQEGEPADDSWKEEFEKTLYEEYGVVPDHYEYIGNDVYQVYVKIDGKIVPYVAVNWKTGDFHG